MTPGEGSAAPPGPCSFSERVAAPLLATAWIATPFAAAGTLRWPAGWAYLAVVGGGVLAHRAVVATRAPAVLARRERVGAGTPRWDLAWVAAFWPLMLAAPVVAGSDTVRLGHPPLPAWLVAPGAALFGAGMALSAWAMVSNPFFEGTSRIQPDQRVIDAGPYRLLRHPGYAGLVLWAISGPLLLRSPLAVAPAVLAAAWVVVRTVLEDRMLRRGLAGYRAYAGRVRWRLLPGAW